MDQQTLEALRSVAIGFASTWVEAIFLDALMSSRSSELFDIGGW